MAPANAERDGVKALTSPRVNNRHRKHHGEHISDASSSQQYKSQPSRSEHNRHLRHCGPGLPILGTLRCQLYPPMNESHSPWISSRGPVSNYQPGQQGHARKWLRVGWRCRCHVNMPSVCTVNLVVWQRSLSVSSEFTDRFQQAAHPPRVRGGLASRRAVVTRHELVDGFPRFDVDDVYLGNGVSELVTLTLQASLDNGDQVLIPAPDYPLWTASTSLAGGYPTPTADRYHAEVRFI
jgi:hypothetical protein